MIKKTLAATAIITMLSTSAIAFGNNNGNNSGNTDNSVTQNPVANATGGTGGNATQGQLQGQIGINSLENDIANTNTSNSTSGALSGSISGSKSKSSVSDSGNSANLNAVVSVDDSYTSNKQNTKQVTNSNTSDSNSISIGGDSYVEAKNNANTAIAPIALSNWGCTMGGSLAVQGDQFGASAGGSNESTDCVANQNAVVVANLFPENKTLQKAELCTGKQHREAFEAIGMDGQYCKPKSTWLGLKPIVSGVKELVLSPFKLIGFVFGL